MLLKTFKGFVGHMESYTNTYLVYDEKSFEGTLIDIANNVEKIQEFVESINIKVKYLILTHCHGDHIDGIKDLKRVYPDIKILIHELDAKGLTIDKINLANELGIESNFIEADLVLKDSDIVNVGDLKLKIIHTPGHTAGSISILVEDALFSGDTLFKGSYGRTDFPTGNSIDMMNSIKKLLELPENVIVYPGHEQSTMIGDEKS